MPGPGALGLTVLRDEHRRLIRLNPGEDSVHLPFDNHSAPHSYLQLQKSE